MKRQRVVQFVGGFAMLGFVGMAVSVNAQTATPFQIIGHLETFELVDSAGNKIADPVAALPFSEARMVVNGISIRIPQNLVVTMPAAYKFPQQIFKEATGPSLTNKNSGLALNDDPKPLAAFEVSIDGNIVCLPTTPPTIPPSCTDTYVAGLVSISQQSLNNSAGYIHQIDPDGVIHVGANPNATSVQAGDTRLRVNDPAITTGGTGRYGLSNEQQFGPGGNSSDARYPDARFQVDQDNPTIHALTGYPMCVPRSINPATKTSTDLKCPAGNRPVDSGNGRFRTTFVMNNVDLNPPANFGNVPIPACGLGPGQCNQNEQAPFVIGDYVTYAGTHAKDAGGEFVSVHTMVANVGIYTKPGADPAYITLDESLIGTMGPLAICAGTSAECQDRIKIEGFLTDPSRIDSVHVYALDYPVIGGGVSLKPKVRRLGPAPKDQAVYGRFRYITGKRALVLFDSTGTRGATRELMVRIDGNVPLADGSDKPDPPGIYAAPIGEYIFPEPTGVQGGPLPPLNFECLAFLVNGWSTDESTVIGQLKPWPGATVPSSVACSQ
ncbi:MAG: hypothetical protein JSS38_15790 [Nitrospira sp.]|nr:hypothetical protein [Nitrospira sp.]MBS0156058.1 hypothetical protein [Nitrospira sp.]MBS0167667.1 hypothetical protein [Nitrospira sp.]MBX3325506.1 hypothetical protein [Nitrospira sp.]